MDSIEKAKIRLQHWIEHNVHHIEDFEEFAAQLEEAGKEDSARYVKEMIALTTKSNELLRDALNSLG